MTSFSEKKLISNRYIHCLMTNLIKKSVIVSTCDGERSDILLHSKGRENLIINFFLQDDRRFRISDIAFSFRKSNLNSYY